MANDLIYLLVEINLAACAAILIVVVLRAPARRFFGPQIAYALWLVVPATAAAILLPERTELAAVPAEAPIALALPVNPDALADFASNTGAMDYSVDASILVVATWLVGVIAAVGLLAVRQLAFLTCLGPLRREQGVGRTLRAEASCVGPALVGSFVPKMVLPCDFETRFDEAERRLILAHEHVHLRGRDPLINTCVALVQCILWFNPVIHFAARLLRADQELACDASVMASFPAEKRRYAEAMLKTQLVPSRLPLGCHWPALGDHPLKQRIAMLQHARPSGRRIVWGATATLLLALSASLTAWAAQPARQIFARVNVDAPALGSAEEDLPQRASLGELRQLELALESDKVKDRTRGLTVGAAQPSRQAVASERSNAPALDSTDEAFIRAVLRGDLRQLESALESGANVNSRNARGLTALVLVARSDDTRALDLLLQSGADPNLTSPGEGNALAAASRRGHIRSAARLVESGARVNEIVPDVGTPLAVAARTGHLNVVKYLVEHGADVNLPSPPPAPWDRWGVERTPLDWAEDGDHHTIANYLKSRGAKM